MATRTKKSKRGFSYRSNGPEASRKAAAGGSGFDRAFTDVIKLFTPADGKNKVRILPRTWDTTDGPEHFAFDAFIHYSVGADNGSYFCLQKMGKGACPVCEERNRLSAEGDDEGAGELKANQTRLVYVIDRNHESDGPKLWKMPAVKIHNAVCDLSDDDETGEMLRIDHPEEGYDISFRRSGKGQRTEYSAVEIARRPSAVSDDEEDFEEWLDFIEENPIPSTLQFFEYDHISAVFGGVASAKVEEEEPKRRRSRSEPEDLDELDDDDEEEEENEEEESKRKRRDLRAEVDGGLKRRKRR